MDEEPAKAPPQPTNGQLHPRERPDGHVCDHGKPRGALQGTEERRKTETAQIT